MSITTLCVPDSNPYRAGRFYFHTGDLARARPLLYWAALEKPWKIERWARWLVCSTPSFFSGVFAGRRRQWHELWQKALTLPGFADARESAVAEMAEYLGVSREEALAQCSGASGKLSDSWKARNPRTADEITRFYQEENSYIGDLVFERTKPLEFAGRHAVESLLFAREQGLKRVLDFGSGDGSCGICYAYYGFEAAMADVAGHLLDFIRWRFKKRGLTGRFYHLPQDRIPDGQFDLVSAFDTFEHLADPKTALREVFRILRPGGFLIANLPFGPTCDHPMHLPHDYREFMRFARYLGFKIKPFTLKEFYVLER
ncbi:MAG: class I SAM-dependent methyltransferase [Elusimicrobia bacterium]|nr:class I SAM-dependent methyltransferase [Elusimicrobiota bacterium]